MTALAAAHPGAPAPVAPRSVAPGQAGPATPEPEAPLNVATLHLGGEVLAIPTRVLREVLEPVAITRVPNAPDFVAALINVRGAVVPLADLRVPFGMAPRAPDENTRILVLELRLDGACAVVGILADSVHEVTEIDPASLEDMPSVGTRWRPCFVRAIARCAGGFVMLPDLEAIFASYLGRHAGQASPDKGVDQ